MPVEVAFEAEEVETVMKGLAKIGIEVGKLVEVVVVVGKRMRILVDFVADGTVVGGVVEVVVVVEDVVVVAGFVVADIAAEEVVRKEVVVVAS